jgi:hypothetical protein
MRGYIVKNNNTSSLELEVVVHLCCKWFPHPLFTPPKNPLAQKWELQNYPKKNQLVYQIT